MTAYQSRVIQGMDLSPAANELPRRQTAVVDTLLTSGRSCFDIYRTDQVRLTSTLVGGGDWHWRLTGASGDVLADCGGYRNQRDCLAAVGAVRAVASSAIVLSR